MKTYKRWKKGIVATLFISAVLAFGILAGAVDAKAETGTGTVKGSNVNVRSDAGTNAPRICSLGNGAALVVTGSKKDAAGNTWYAVSFLQNGKNYTGYIIATYVNYTPSAQAPQDNTQDSSSQSDTAVKKWKGKVVGTNVNIRQKAVSGSVIAQLSNGAQVTVRKEKKGTDQKLWYYISFKKDGATKKGWRRSDFIKKTESQPQQDDTTGTATDDSSQSGPAEIDVSGITDSADSPEDNPAAEEPKDDKKDDASQASSDKKKGVITGNFVRIRKKAVTGSVITQLNSGAKVTVKKEVKGSDGYIWYKISFKYNGKSKSGYVRSDFVKISETQKEETDNKDDTKTDVTVIKKGTVTGNNVRVRKSPVTGAVVCQLMKGDVLIVDGEKKGTDNYVWYNASFTYDGAQKNGYIRSDFVKVTEETVEKEEEDKTEEETEIDISQDENFEEYLTQQGFPETYKDSLRELHALHPEWEFRAVATGLEWNDAVAAESKVGTSLVSKYAITSWKSTEKTAYNWKTDTYYTFDGGAWVAASKELVSYYMDPRNFLSEATIFQFESLEYESYQNKTGVSRLLENTFMSGKYTEPDGTQKSYASSFVKIGKKTGVNPYHLAARCYQEQGKGTSGSISGSVSGYKDIFNYYNVGAYAANGNSPIIQGLKYAAASTTNPETNYSRPWNTRYKSLLGGAEYIAQKYIKTGQNTLYFQKFNVVNKKHGLYRHQYMTNIQAAEAEAIKMSKAYTKEDTKLAFYIPVYNNMPEVACPKPVSDANPNNYLATLEVDGQELTPIFNPETLTYDLTVPKKIKKVKISATAIVSTSTVEGTGKVKLKRGENEVKITCTAENGAIRTYTLYIVRK